MKYLLCLACAMTLLLSAAAAATNPTDEEQNRASCTGTCSTCPGKAQAVAGLAGMSSMTISLKGALDEDAALALRGKIEALAGVESCVVDSANNSSWIAFDGKKTTPEVITRAFEKQGSAVDSVSAPAAPLPALTKGYERRVVYFLAPRDEQTNMGIKLRLKNLGGIAAHRREPFFNMLLVDYNPAKLKLDAVKQALLDLGYAAGLPGEEMTQPE